MTAAFKAGIVAILALIASVVGVVFIWQINPYGSYRIDVYFPNVGGLKNGARVELMGVEIGHVSNLQTDARRVQVTLDMNKDIQVPQGSIFSIISKGIVGDKSVEIIPPSKATEGYIQPNAVIENGNPPTELNTILAETAAMLKSTRSFIEDDELRKNIAGTIEVIYRTSKEMAFLFKDIQEITKGFSSLTKQTDQLLAQLNNATSTTVPEVQKIVQSVRNIAGNMDALSGRMNQIAQDPQLFSQTKGSIQNINALTHKWNTISDNLKDITEDIHEITGDKEIKSNIKTVAKNAGKLTDTILNPVSSQEQVKISFRAEMLGGLRVDQAFQTSPSIKGNFNILGNMGFGPVPHFRFGLDEIGEGNRFNLQLGSSINEDAQVRFGIVRGKLGIGSDFGFELFNLPMSLSGELYDINAPHMRIGILQNIYQDYGVSLYWDNQFGQGINEFNLGVRWQPSN